MKKKTANMKRRTNIRHKIFRLGGKMRKVLSLLTILLSLIIIDSKIFSDSFRYKYIQGDKYRCISKVDENVYKNGKYINHAEIINRIAFTISNVSEKSGYIVGNFQTSSKSLNSPNSFVLETDYASEFWRDEYGKYKIDESFYMPVVRDVPMFPERDLLPGDTWTAPGEERHDFRQDFGLSAPFKIPFTANYKYLGKQRYETKDYPTISASYSIFYQPIIKEIVSLYPIQVMGYSNQTIIWDVNLGQPLAYNEIFKIQFIMSNGDLVEYAGTAEAKLIHSETMDKAKLETDIKEKLREEKIENVNIRRSNEGVIIDIENIQFEADSSAIRIEEKDKLSKIAQILKKYSDRDLRITGHTALAGTADERKLLSIKRAQAVADFLISSNTRSPEHITVLGLGADQPIAENTTSEGMARNRRVEILILEN